MMELEKIIKKVWPQVRKKHLFPHIPLPSVIEGGDDIALEIKSKQLFISNAFFEKLKVKMDEEEIVETILDHGLTHYMYCPWDFHTHLFLYSEAKKAVGQKEQAQRATTYFMDVVADTYCIKEKDTKIATLYKNLPKNGMTEVLTSLYEKIWGEDLESGGHEELVNRLSRIPYLERAKWGDSVKKFAQVIQPLLEEEVDNELQSSQRGPNPLGKHSLDNYSLDEIDRGMREFASAVDNIQEFKETVEDLREELEKKGYGTGGMGRGKGNHPLDANLLYYMKLAESYTLPVRQLPIEKRGYLHPHSHKPWEIGKPFADIDLWTSFGKIMPSITKIWTKQEGETHGELEGTPDCLIIIDSSGSMINPCERLSYAVLGAACACNAYRKQEAKVAVYNFSDALRGNKIILDFNCEKDQIYYAICRYFGGGTALDLDDIIHLLSRADNPDIFIITDMQITNLEKVIDYVNTIENRVTAVHVGHNAHSARFKDGTKKSGNISLFNVKEKEDIPKIILGKVDEYLNSPVG
jgi:hypothetical protein